MKTSPLSFLAALALSVSVQAQAPVGPGSIKIGKVQVAAQNTPQFQLQGGETKRYEVKKWLEFEVNYDTAPEVIDELTFKFIALVEKKLLEGDVTYGDISKGKDHYAVMYISPKSLERLTGGKPFTPASLENVWVEISRQGQVLAKESLKPGAQPNVPRLAGMVLPKDQTPFAALYYDRYEAIKRSR